MTDMIDDRRAKRNVAVLVAAQAILGAQMPMIFVIGGLAGGMLATNVCLATLPISFIVFGSMITAPWLSPLMQRHGRRFGFVIGATAGAVGALVAAYGLYVGSFGILLAGSLITGIYMSAQGFYRFAATDTASEAFRPKAISYVMAGGLISAIIGPQLNKLVQDAFVVPFLGTYLAVAALNIFGMMLFFWLDLPKGSKETPFATNAPKARNRLELLRDPRVVVAIICATVTYSLMNLVMTSTPLAVVGCGFTKNNANDIVVGACVGHVCSVLLYRPFDYPFWRRKDHRGRRLVIPNGRWNRGPYQVWHWVTSMSRLSCLDWAGTLALSRCHHHAGQRARPA